MLCFAPLGAGVKAFLHNTRAAELQPTARFRASRCIVSAQLSNFARSLSVETAFTVLAIARSLKAAGKDIVELEAADQ